MSFPLFPTVLFEDDHFLFLDKPAGLDCAIQKEGRPFSVSRWLQEHRPELQPFGYRPDDFGLLNRIDAETSGVLVAGKTALARDGFLTLTKQGKIKKEYLALAESIITRPLSVSLSIGARSRTAHKVRAIPVPRKKDRALPARTDFLPLSHCAELRATLLQATIYQGRRHQIRAHAEASAFPLIGDILYGSTRQIPKPGCAQPAFLLHSFRVSFSSPITGTAVNVSAPLPDSLLALRKQFLWFDLLENLFT